MTRRILRQSLLASTVFASGLFLAAPASAQVAKEGAAAPAVADENTVVVTGTLIKNPNLIASSPVAVVGAEEVGLRQSNTAEEILRTIPGAVPGIGSNVNNGQGGAATLNLRGLGTNRNTILLNGARLTPFGLTGVVDTNNVPLSLIERVDVLTGGASTTYGADAVSGVVNFVTKKDFAGVEADIANSLTERGDGHVVRTDLTIGANFDDGRGNATLALGYQKQDAVYQGARPFGVFARNSSTGGAGGSSVSIPGRFSLGARDATAPGGAASGGTYQIDPAAGAFGTSQAFTNYNYNPTNVYQTPFLRYNIFGAAHYQVSDAFEVYTEGMFSKQTVSSIVAPSGVFSQALTIRYNNPFIPAIALQQICNANGLSAAQCNLAAAIPLAGAQPAAVTSGSGANAFVTNVARRFVEAGTRNSDYTTTFFQQRAGFRGAITSTLNYDVYGTYGQSDISARSAGNGLLSRLLDEVDPVSTTACRGGATGCVPINLFGGAGSISQAALAYLNVATTVGTQTSLATAHGVVSGDFGVGSPWASNPVGVAVGVEYRKYTAANRSDLPSQTPGEVLGAGGATIDVSGSYAVKEAFAELIAPLVEDQPGFKSLTLEAGVRHSDYNTAGKNNTWKLGGSWEPIDGLKFRGNYQRAVRAPNIAELFAPVATGLTNLAVDPCQGAAPTASVNLRAVCIAQGAPAGVIGSIAPPAAGQANSYGGGNPNLKVETARTYTLGGVFQPSFAPGLSITADYYHIAIKDAITFPTPGDVIGACFNGLDAASSVNPACTAIRRDPLTGTLNGSAATVPGLPTPLSNLGRLLTDGIDLTVNYKRDVGVGVLNLGFDGNWTHRAVFQATPTSLARNCVGLYSPNCGSQGGGIQPKFSWSQRTSLTLGDFDLSVLWRHIGKEQVEGDDPETGRQIKGDQLDGSGDRALIFAPYRHISNFDYFDVAVRANLSEHLTLTATVANLADKKPPIIGANTGGTSQNSGNTYPSTYDTLGRAYRLGASIRF